MNPTFQFKAPVWLWSGNAAWHFITLPKDLSCEIKGFDMPRRGFGSIPVEVTIGTSNWKTSIFPEKKGTYILPIKKDIRKKEKISEDKKVHVKISLQ